MTKDNNSELLAIVKDALDKAFLEWEPESKTIAPSVLSIDWWPTSEYLAKAAISALNPQEEWRDISTAIEGEKMMLGAYSKDKWYEALGKSMRTNIPCGFREYVRPTHWQPLPMPPKSQPKE